MAAPQYVSKGEPVKPRADDHNAFVDSHRWMIHQQRSGGAAVGLNSHASDVILVRNDTGEDRARFEIVGLDEPIISSDDNLPEFKTRIAFKGVIPTAEFAGRFGVLLQPLKAADGPTPGEIGLAAVGGTVQCKLDFGATESSAAHAEIAIGECTHLEAVSAGSAQILAPTSATGIKWGVIRLGHSGGGAPQIRFRVLSLAPYLVEISSACVAVNAEVLDVSCNSGLTPGDEVLIFDPSGCWFTVPIDVLEGAHGIAVSMSKGAYWDVPDCVEEVDGGPCWWMVIHLCCMEDLFAI